MIPALLWHYLYRWGNFLAHPDTYLFSTEMAHQARPTCAAQKTEISLEEVTNMLALQVLMVYLFESIGRPSSPGWSSCPGSASSHHQCGALTSFLEESGSRPISNLFTTSSSPPGSIACSLPPHRGNWNCARLRRRRDEIKPWAMASIWGSAWSVTPLRDLVVAAMLLV